MRRIDILPRIRVGARITAELLSNITDAINANTSAVAAPRESVGADSETGTIFTEVARSSNTVRVYDQNDENYADIDVMSSVTF